MKRNCNGCRADDDGCTLGYKTEITKFRLPYLHDRKPLEECEKPKTYNSYLYLKELNSKKKLKTHDTN